MDMDELKNLPDEELPDGFHERLMQRIAAEKRNAGFDYKKYGSLAAGLIVTVSLMGVLGSALSSALNGGQSGTQGIAPAAGVFETRMLAENFYPDASAEDESAIQAMPAPAAASVSMAGAETGPLNSSSGQKMMRAVNIGIFSEDLIYATQVINGLPGYNTSSRIRRSEAGEDKYGSADITRRVVVESSDHVMNVIRGLGTLRSESESITNYTSEYRELEIRLRNINFELDRMNLLLSKADSLDNVIFIDGRISEIAWRLDSTRGRMNEINGLTESVYVNITIISDKPEDEPVPVPFGERLSNAFKKSAEAAQYIAEGTAINLSRLFMPALIIAAMCWVCWWIYKLIKKGKRK